jgi:hypothetical protein
MTAPILTGFWPFLCTQQGSTRVGDQDIQTAEQQKTDAHELLVPTAPVAAGESRVVKQVSMRSEVPRFGEGEGGGTASSAPAKSFDGVNQTWAPRIRKMKNMCHLDYESSDDSDVIDCTHEDHTHLVFLFCECCP